VQGSRLVGGAHPTAAAMPDRRRKTTPGAHGISNRGGRAAAGGLILRLPGQFSGRDLNRRDGGDSMVLGIRRCVRVNKDLRLWRET